MKSFQQFLQEKFYGYKSRGGNSPSKLMAKKVNPSKPFLFKSEHKPFIPDQKDKI